MLQELERARPRSVRGRLDPRVGLEEAGIDTTRFLDAVNRIEGLYGMRFRDDWLSEIRTGDEHDGTGAGGPTSTSRPSAPPARWRST